MSERSSREKAYKLTGPLNVCTLVNSYETLDRFKLEKLDKFKSKVHDILNLIHSHEICGELRDGIRASRRQNEMCHVDDST